MLKYHIPAKAFCEKYHEHCKSLDYWNFIAPHNSRTQRALTALTSVSSICFQHAGDDIAAGVFLDAAQQKSTIIVAGNPTITTETREFLLRLFDRLQDWARGERLAHAEIYDSALTDIASMLLTFQAKRWMLRLHDNPKDRATLDARLATIRDATGPTDYIAIQNVMNAVERIVLQARTMFSGTGLRSEVVEDVVRSLLDCERLVCSPESRAALEFTDRFIVSYSSCRELLDMSKALAIGDIDKLEDDQGRLIPKFSVIRYIVNILSIVRYAKHLVDFARKERAFASQSLVFDFCDQQHALDESGTVVFETRPDTDRPHAAMRVLQAILERADLDNHRFFQTIGSSTSVCVACYHALSNLDRVKALPERIPVPIYCVGPQVTILL